MEAAIQLERTYRPVGLGGAFTRQFRLLWTSRRPLLLLVALLAVLVLAGEPWSDAPLARFLTVWPVWLIPVGPIWAFAVFHNEGPSHRLYHWSQPVARDTHALARIAAGVAWLWLLYGVLILAGLVFGAVDGDAWQLAEVSAAGWVNLFTAPLLGYLGVCLLTIPSDYPIRWFFGILFLVPLLISLLAEWLELDEAARLILRPLGDPAWGLGITMVGALGASVDRIETALRAAADPAFQHRHAFEVGTWWVATPLWVLLLVALVWFLSTRHPDVLPRWRRSH